ncbi:MAG: MFS transporter [Desulfobacteraceae bacterium]|nr:MFS transporter [Desulfobacteraceae bacterium]
MNNTSTNKDYDETQNENASSLRSQLGPLLFLTAIFFLNFISRIIFAPLMPSIEKDLGISHGEAGSLFLLISFGYFITLLGSGFISSRLKHRRTIIHSATVVGVALLIVSQINNLWGIRLGLLLLGMAAGIYLPSGIATLTSLINSRHWGKAIAIHELAPNMSFVVAPLLTEALLLWFSWRGVLVFLGVASVLAGLAFARFGKGGEFPGKTPSFRSSKMLFSEPAFWIMIILFSLGITGSLGIFAMLPLYLVTEYGMDRSWANTLIGLSRIPAVGMAFLAGWASDLLGPRRTLMAIFLLSGLTTVLLGVTSGYWTIIMIFLQPIIAVCFFPPGLAALSSIGPPSTRNVTVSLTIPVAFTLGSGVIPTGIGIMADADSFSLAIALTGGLILMGAVLSFYLRSE